MARNEIYTASWTGYNGWRYYLEMIEPGEIVGGAPDLFAGTESVIDLGDNVIVSASTGKTGYDKLPTGWPQDTTFKISVNLNNAPAEFRDYVLNPASAAFDFFGQTTKTLNVWTIFSDEGNTSIEDPLDFTIQFQGAQKRVPTTAGEIALQSNTIEIELTDIARVVFESLSSELMTGASTITRFATSDLMYQDGSRYIIKQEFAADGSFDRQAAILSPLRYVHFGTSTALASNLLYGYYVRKPYAQVIVDGSPFDSLTFYKQNYLPNGEAGDALTTLDDVYCIVAIQNSDGDTVGGLSSKNDEGGFWRNDCKNVWDALSELTFAYETKARIEYSVTTTNGVGDTVPATYKMVLKWRRLRETFSDSVPTDAYTLAATDFITTAKDYKIGDEAISGTEGKAIGGGDLDSYDVKYAIAGSIAEAGRTVRLILHNMPTNIFGQEPVRGVSGGTDITTYTEHTLHCNKFYYFDDTLPAALESYPVLVHRQIDWNDGFDTVTSDPGFSGVDIWVSTAGIHGSYLSGMITGFIAIQQQFSMLPFFAKLVTDLYSNAKQISYEQDFRLSMALLRNLGDAYMFDPSSVDSNMTGFPTRIYLVQVEPDYGAGKSKAKFLGMSE